MCMSRHTTPLSLYLLVPIIHTNIIILLSTTHNNNHNNHDSGLTQYLFRDFVSYWRTASISLSIAPFVLITIHFFKFLAALWSKSQTQTQTTVEEQYCFKYISAVYFCFTFYFAFHLIFGPVYICDFDTMYLSVYSHISAAFAFIVCMVHNRIEKQIVQNIHHALEMKRLFVRYVRLVTHPLLSILCHHT